MITFTKIKYDKVPIALAKRVLSWSDEEVTIDDVGLTALQIARLTDYFLQEGYKSV